MRFSRGRSTPARRAIWHYPSGFTAVFSVLIPVVCFLLLTTSPAIGRVVVEEIQRRAPAGAGRGRQPDPHGHVLRGRAACDHGRVRFGCTKADRVFYL